MSKKPLRSIKLEKGKLEMKDEFELIFERTISKFGNGAKIDKHAKPLIRTLRTNSPPI
jgi:hypothetical protein